MSLSPAQLSLLEEFEQGLDPRWPERSRVPARVLGYGEISTVFAIQADGLEDLAFKRLPLFDNEDEIKAYQVAYAEYNRLLQEEIGLCLPAFGYCSLANQAGRPIFYIVQRQLPAASIGNQAMHLLPRDRIMLLVRRILQELRLVWDFNRRQDRRPCRRQIGLDGQISNWSTWQMFFCRGSRRPRPGAHRRKAGAGLLSRGRADLDPIPVDAQVGPLAAHNPLAAGVPVYPAWKDQAINRPGGLTWRGCRKCRRVRSKQR
jgi:hypothetical protein